jgi:hypothetical protein
MRRHIARAEHVGITHYSPSASCSAATATHSHRPQAPAGRPRAGQGGRRSQICQCSSTCLELRLQVVTAVLY